MDVAGIFSDAAGFLTSAAGGGGLGAITGIIGWAVGGVFKYFQRRQEISFEEKKWAHEFKLQELNLKAKAQENEHELAIVEQRGSWDGLVASHAAAASIPENESRWVNNLRGSARPVLTGLLWVLAAFVFIQILKGALDQVLPAEVIADLVRYMVYSVFYSAATATVWWFGDRMITPPGMRNRIALPAQRQTL